MRFLAAAELIEADLWQQYAELGGVTSGEQNATSSPCRTSIPTALEYISSNTLDEISHAEFLNAYLASVGAEPVDLDRFRTLPSSKAKGAKQIGRLTNLTQLHVDTSWYVRYRSAANPDFGATFAQAIPQLFAGKFTAIRERTPILAQRPTFRLSRIRRRFTSALSNRAVRASMRR